MAEITYQQGIQWNKLLLIEDGNPLMQQKQKMDMDSKHCRQLAFNVIVKGWLILNDANNESDKY